MANVAQPKKPAQGKSEKGKCSRIVRDLPLERFRLPLDGRKWRVLARKRRSLLLDMSEYANGDGTFERQLSGQTNPVNFSPSEQRLLKHWAKGSLYRYQKELRLLDLLDWDRPNHHHRRIYVISAAAPDPFLPREEHVPDSKEKHVPDSQEQVQDSEEQVQDSQEHVQQLEPTSVSSVFEVPSTPRPPISPAVVGDSNGNDLFWWHNELLCIRRGRRKRLPNLDRYVGKPAQDVCDFLIRRGFSARIVTEISVVPDHVPRLNPESRMERNMRALGLPPDAFARRTEKKCPFPPA
jgi:hypothetical protein